MLIIFHDNHKNMNNIVNKISEGNKSQIKVINICDYLNNCGNFEINFSDVIYFLCNDNYLNNLIIEKLDKIQCKILNKGYYLKNYNKEKVQKKLLKNQINTPKIVDFNEKINKKVILKAKTHTLPVNIFENMVELKKFLLNKNMSDFYAEEFIEKDIEYKIYYVNDKIFFYDNIETFYNEKLNKTLQLIGEIFELDIYSVDVIFVGEKFYIIDINSSSPLFMSKFARQELTSLAKK